MSEETANPLPPSAPSGARTEIVPGVWMPESSLRLAFSRSSGPGGQNVNKVNTKAELWVPLDAINPMTDAARARLRKLAGRRVTAAGEIHIASETERTQMMNRIEAMQRLAELVAAALIEPRKRRKTKPSAAAKRRRVESKRRRADTKSKRRFSGERE